MGIDFIYKVKPHLRKGWDRGVSRLSRAQLFRTAVEEIRTITVKPQPGSSFSASDTYELRGDGSAIDVYRQGKLIGLCEHPPESVMVEIRDEGGIALGEFHRSREHSGLVEIAVCVPPKTDEDE